jgi:predicted transcriptional regulator
MTRGRTRPGHIDLPLEALVRAVSTDAVGSATSERRRILELSTATVQSVAELSAHLRLPLGVVRVLVGDLAEEGLVVVHTQKDQTPQSNLKVLESVLNGISSL